MVGFWKESGVMALSRKGRVAKCLSDRPCKREGCNSKTLQPIINLQHWNPNNKRRTWYFLLNLQ
jgi:hypothetical protein